MQNSPALSQLSPDDLSRVARTSLVESVYQTLMEAIVSGRLAGGASVSEVELARKLQVSRTPIHEAAVRLVADGLMEQSLGNRLRVASFDTKDIIEIYGMRRLLESAAAESAALHLDDATIESMRRDADELAHSFSAVDWGTRAIAFDMRFHEIIARASGSRRLGDDIRRYRRMVKGFCQMSGTLPNLRNAWREHLHIIQAIEARKPFAVRDAMSAHIDARLQALLSAMSNKCADSAIDGPVANGQLIAPPARDQ